MAGTSLATGGWDSWGAAYTDIVELQPLTNRIELAPTGSGGPMIDYVEVQSVRLVDKTIGSTTAIQREDWRKGHWRNKLHSILLGPYTYEDCRLEVITVNMTHPNCYIIYKYIL